MCKICATLQGALYYSIIDFVVLKSAFYAYAYTYTQYMYNSIIHVYKRMYIYAPLLEAAAPTVFMAWL
jgi:hypothetical protein